MRLRGYLRSCGLAHWYATVVLWLEHYSGLEEVVADDRDAPHATVVAKLRLFMHLGARPNDFEFARVLSELEFHYYRVKRGRKVSEREPVELDEHWKPMTCPLSEFQDGYVIAAYQADHPQPTYESTQRWLLQCLHRARLRHD